MLEEQHISIQQLEITQQQQTVQLYQIHRCQCRTTVIHKN